MTIQTAASEFAAQLVEISEGRRGFISLPRFAKSHEGTTVKDLRAMAELSGFKVEPHGRYGFCAFKSQAA